MGILSVEVVNPVSGQEINEEYDGAETPGDGVSPGNGGQFVDISYRNADVGDSE